MNATGSVLVDTNVVVAYFRGEKALAPRFLQAATLYLPWVVLGELHYGASRSQRREAQLEGIRDFLRTAVVLLPDQSTAEHYGQLKAELAQVGKPIPDNDLWIAALARQYDLPLATRDAHFMLVPRLKSLAW
jgi:tRNA(fMet)-specific endonuclease VapC